MNSCKFAKELNRLRKSSSDSIDNIESFGSFKNYMHIARRTETDLKVILRSVNSSGKKSLVLLCGSAGDGKSHLLSYLKNSDEEQLLENYIVYNDATESGAPSKTAIQTLNEVLNSFNDENLDLPGKNMILAINLGVLSNFIESEYGEQFSEFRNYVEKSDILTNKINDTIVDKNSNFQHVSFSDYHMYNLSEHGVHAEYIEKIFEKIFTQNEKNVFYIAYSNSCFSCPLSQKCPVKNNYEYMMKKERQSYVAELLVKTIIQDKIILTTRELLNFIYDIIVSRNFSYKKFQKLMVDDTAFLKEYLEQITPAILYDSTDVTVLMNELRKYDPLLVRTEKADEIAISYYVSVDIKEDVKNVFVSTPYEDVICAENMISKISSDKTLKSSLYNLITRVDMIGTKNEFEDVIYRNYLRDLYWYNAGQGKKLGKLYNLIDVALTQWCGSDGDGNLCLDSSHKGIYLYESVQLQPSIEQLPDATDELELERFAPTIIATFVSEQEVIELDIDFSLYNLLNKLSCGYIQTAEDRNNHADFISFVNRILQTGTLDKNITILSENGKKATITKSMFGYKFKVVK